MLRGVTTPGGQTAVSGRKHSASDLGGSSLVMGECAVGNCISKESHTDYRDASF